MTKTKKKRPPISVLRNFARPQADGKLKKRCFLFVISNTNPVSKNLECCKMSFLVEIKFYSIYWVFFSIFWLKLKAPLWQHCQKNVTKTSENGICWFIVSFFWSHEQIIGFLDAKMSFWDFLTFGNDIFLKIGENFLKSIQSNGFANFFFVRHQIFEVSFLSIW